MGIKIGPGVQIRSLFRNGRSGKSIRKPVYVPRTASVKTDSFTRSPSVPQNNSGFLSGVDMSDEMRNGLKIINEAKNNITYVKPRVTDKNDFKGHTEFNFEFIDFVEDNLNGAFRKRLDKMEVPSDVTFTFDYDIDNRKATVTSVSDENYREKITEALSVTGDTVFLAYASRVMNGNIFPALYQRAANGLMKNFGQDIADIYIDENGAIGGMNNKLKAAIKAHKEAKERDAVFITADVFGFQTNDPEKVIKRMISGGDSSPNVSRMGYDGERFYTDDGEFKFGKDRDPDLMREEKYIMRGSVSVYMLSENYYDRWIDNEELFK